MINTMYSKNMDQRLCNTLINQNMRQSSVGDYKECPSLNSIKFNFVEYEPEIGGQICNVSIFNKHPVDIIFELSFGGLNVPCQTIFINPIGLNFDGVNFDSFEGIYDVIPFLRTNYAHLIKKNNMFASKKDVDVIYTKNVAIIRDRQYKFLQLQNVVLMGIVMMFPPSDIKLMKNKENKNILSSTTFLKIQMIIESAFQVCICDSYPVIVISLYPDELNIPVDDQILIYNYCILKYGHKFKNIIFGIQTNDIQLFNYIDSNISKPQDMTKDIDSKYETELMKSKIK